MSSAERSHPVTWSKRLRYAIGARVVDFCLERVLPQPSFGGWECWMCLRNGHVTRQCHGPGEHLKEHECSDWPDKTGEACGLCGKAIEGRVP